MTISNRLSFLPSPMTLPFLLLLLLLHHHQHSQALPDPCARSYCGNITLSYPFSTNRGCGLLAFDSLLFCINDVLMLHLPSGSYRVLSIDYAFHTLTLHDPTMSTCQDLSSSTKGFVLPYPLTEILVPSPTNVFLLLRCQPDSPLFQGFPEKHLPCRNVSTLGCEDYYRCPAWENGGGVRTHVNECCAVGFGEMRGIGINVSRLGCEGYSSAYNVAPLREESALDWSYGIKVEYEVPLESVVWCRNCEATGGRCGYDSDDGGSVMVKICFCRGWNSTSDCDAPVLISLGEGSYPQMQQRMGLLGFLIYILSWTLWK